MTDVRDPDISDSPPRSMEALGFADQFLVWSVRVWAQSNNPDGTDPSHYYKLMREAFAKAGLKDTHLVFDRFMTLFTASLKRPLAFHAPNCSCLSREELFFVCLVADAQNDMLPRALATTAPPAAVRPSQDETPPRARDVTPRGRRRRNIGGGL